MKNYTFLKVISAVLCLVFTISCAACANVPELDTSGRTVIYAPSFDGTNDMPTPDAGNVTPSADTAETTAQQTADTVYSFLAAGDNIIHEAIFTDAHKRAENGVGYNFKPMYDGVADMISSADIAFVNQEGPIAGASFGVTGYPMFNAPDSAGDTLVELGFDIVNIANNHMLDKWESGLYHTIEYWKTKDVLLLGAFTETDYDNIRVYTCPDGTKISFLSYTYGTNDMKLDSDKYDMFIPLIDERDIVRQVGLAKEAGDMVFVSIHWGNENKFDPTGEQRRLAQVMADNGVDVVIGHHPHVLQPAEWLTGKNGGKTFVTYSIGNMISTMHPSYNMVGAFLTFDIRITAAGERSIENPLLVPIMCHYSTNRDGLQVYKLEDYTEELMKAHGSQLQGAFTMNTLYGYVTNTIPAEFLPQSFLDKVGQ